MVTTVTFATAVLCCSVAWTFFLIYDARRKSNPLSTVRSLGLLCHNIPAAFLLCAAKLAGTVEDTALVWFAALMIFRYWRTLINIYFFFQYKPAVATADFKKITPDDCTVIVPTVGALGNIVFDDMIASIICNRPGRLIFDANTGSHAKEVEDHIKGTLANIEAGNTSYQKEHGIGPIQIATEVLVLNANVSNKREQVVHAFSEVQTDIIVMADDTVVWHSRFLQATLPAFESPKVGCVGTRKWVKRIRSPRDTTKNFFVGLCKQYLEGLWNTIGVLYLIRHNFEIRATNAADGGVFCVSGRTSLIRSSIFNNAEFTKVFLNEYILRFGNVFPGWGPVLADDDNFYTRWVLNHGWDIKIQSSEEATMTTILGGMSPGGLLPNKFLDQCKRWSRTTFRQNPVALVIDRTIWWKTPLTVWTTYLPWLYNAALLWDGLAVYALTHTDMYAQSPHRKAILCALIGFIWLTKLVKSIPWYWQYPMDFFLYFVIPAAPLFSYYHSLLKFWTALTFFDLTWSGRKLKEAAR